MKVRSQIQRLLKAGKGKARLNGISYLRYRKSGDSDHLEICFDSINGVKIPMEPITLQCRYIEGIIVEAKQATGIFLTHVSEKLIGDFANDVCDYGDEKAMAAKAAKYDAFVASRVEAGRKSAASMTAEERTARAKKARAARGDNC